MTNLNSSPIKKKRTEIFNAIPEGKVRYVGIVSYDGTDFCGWQSQTNAVGIQDILEKRLEEITREKVRVHGSGRTDSGVHARGQVFHFDATWNHPAKVLLRALRCGLPDGISVQKIKIAKNGFHARFSTRGKRYVYTIYQGFASPFDTRYVWSIGDKRLDVEKMKIAGKMLLGEYDFSAFGAMHATRQKENSIKDLRRLDVQKIGKKILITTEASGYLYKMVRRLVGGLYAVGIGKMSPEELLKYREDKICDAKITTAPARGLVMEKVFY